MSVATSTAIGIGLGVSAGSSLVGAKMASNSAKNAAKTQTAVSTRAAALSQQAFQQQQQLQAPYQQAGRSAVGNLNALMNPGVPYTPQMQAAQAQASRLPSFALGGGPPQGPQPGRAPMQGGPQMAGAGPMQGPPPGGPMAAAMAPQGDMVPMVSRDGERGMVPRSRVQEAIAAGARMA